MLPTVYVCDHPLLLVILFPPSVGSRATVAVPSTTQLNVFFFPGADPDPGANMT